jgi:glyoxylase-like metal-dependent hydrolase (beta-lactamase superfamily II)
MIFRQLFDSVSSTYSYVLASRHGGEALIIDPVLEKVDRYLKLMEELDLKLVKAVDTHLHADHITGLGALRDRTRCITIMGEQSQVDVVSMRIGDGDRLGVEGVSLDVLYTPGHTDDSNSLHFGDRVFTGDSLLIRGAGRTDFQNGDSRTGAIPGSLHAPYGELQDNIGEGGLIHELARSGKTIVFYCAFGERSAMAVQAAQDQGLATSRHIEGGMSAWTKAGGATH